MALECADLGNAGRPFYLYEQWIRRIMSEFAAQGLKEIDLGLKPTSKFHVQHNMEPALIAESQLLFIDHIVLPKFKALKGFLPDTTPIYNQILKNKDHFLCKTFNQNDK